MKLLQRLPYRPTIVLVTPDADLAARTDVVLLVRDGIVRAQSEDLMRGQ